ncbi:MAG: PAS domain S-box protein, partial [Nitrospirae bacterium]|nr:PAS domain S-box protein [Nitrospirota bacterium]
MKPSPARTVSNPRPWPAILLGLSFLAATGGYWRALIVHDQRQPPVVQTDQAPKTLAHQALGHPLANLALVAGCLLSFMLGFGFYTVQYGRRLNQQLREEIEDHEEAREKLRRSETRFRQVVEHISEVFWLATPDKKRFLYISPGYDTIWGRSRDRLYQRPLDWLDALHPEDQERIRVSLDTLAAGGYEREYRIIRPDGSLRWIRDRAFPVRNERGLVEAIAGTAEDITERKRAEQQLRDTEILYRLLLQSTDQGIFGLDAEGRCTFLNQAAQEMFGYPPQSVLGENMHRLIHHSYPDGSSYPQEACAIFSAFRTGRGCRRDTEVMWRSDGTAFPVEYSSYPLFDDGANKGAVIAFTDITIRKQAEEALRESETRFRTMADTAPVMIWMSGPDKLCTYFNQGWLGYTGRTMEQELGSGWAQGVHQEDLDRRLRTYEEAFARREPFRMEYRLRKVDGQYGWILDSGTPRQLPNGDFAGYIGSCIDITERTRAEASLDERVRLSSFTAEVSLTLNREMSIDEILRRCAEMAVHHLDLAFARIWTVEPGDLCESCFKAADCTDRTQCLHLRASAGLSTNLHGEYRRVPMGALKIGRIAQGTGLMSTNDVLGDERLPNKEWMQQNGLQSFAGLPLVIEGEVYGVLGVFARMPLPEATVRTLESVCNGIAATIARKRTASKLQLTQFTVDHAVDAIYWVDPRAKILEVNDAACTMVGYSKDELCAMTVH